MNHFELLCRISADSVRARISCEAMCACTVDNRENLEATVKIQCAISEKLRYVARIRAYTGETLIFQLIRPNRQLEVLSSVFLCHQGEKTEISSRSDWSSV